MPSHPFLDSIDEGTRAIYLKVPGEQVVLLQGFFELYENVGICRTLSIRDSLVAIITTPSMLEDCLSILNAIKTNINWEIVPRPSEAVETLFLGYFKKVQPCCA
ncbi:MAG: DUF4911 domain-containing protein [Oligoflexia bacterium]|nr:DUF4911 domain-containing protein [Oligoflexia bacterium]